MDPNATLERMLEISKEDQREFRDEIHELCELVLALDGYLRGGGFLPRAWAPGSPGGVGG